MACPVAATLWGRSGRRTRDVLHDCRFDDVRGGRHVLHDRGGAGAGFEPIHLAHPAELHAQSRHADRARDLRRHFHLLPDRVAHHSRRQRRSSLFRAWRCSSASCWRSEVLASSFSSFITLPLRSRLPTSSPRSPRKQSRPLTDFFRKNLDKGRRMKMMRTRSSGLRQSANWHVIPARKSGYIQSVDNAALLRVARDRKTIVRMERGIGEFVVQNTALASLALEDPPDQETIAALQATFIISRLRTVEQDVAFGIRQIVDMALKALSPGINDTTTAVMCVDYLTAILARFAPRPIPFIAPLRGRRTEGDRYWPDVCRPAGRIVRPNSKQRQRQCRHHVADARRFSNSFQFDGQSTPPAGAPRTSTTDRRTGRAHRRVCP